MSKLDRNSLWALCLILGMMAFPAECEESRYYGAFQGLLDRHLTERDLPCGGLVSWFDYDAALASEDTPALLARQDDTLAAFDADTLDTREEALAFWINAYNYFMVQHILTHPVDGEIVASVRDFGSLFRPYRVFGLKRFDVGGEYFSLREIELDVLLGQEFAERGWKDARVHFAVNCASVGCPPLRASVYRAETIDRDLTDNTRRALDTPLHLRREGQSLLLTELFDWYEDDFVDFSGSIGEFIEGFGSDQAQAALRAANRIRYIDYDWRLNVATNLDDVAMPSC